MRTILRLTAAALLTFCAFTLSLAQESDFTLGSGRVGEAYQQSIQKVLAEKYGVRLESGSQSPAFEWAQVEDLPPGLRLNGDGTITGVPRSRQEEPYRFRVKVTDKAMLDAEPLELSFSLQVMAPRIRLVRNNAPRLVPMDRPAGQAVSTPASNPVASVIGEGDGNADATPAPATAAAQPETPPDPPPAGGGQGAGGEAQTGTDGTNTQAHKPDPSKAVNINEYISLTEYTEGGNHTISEAQAAKVPSKSIKDQLRELNFRPRADPESTIGVLRTNPAGGGREGLKFNVSADLITGDGTTPLPLTGDPAGNPPARSSASHTPGNFQAELLLDGSTTTINLKLADAKADDTVRVIVDAVSVSDGAVLGTQTFDIELTGFGWRQRVSPSAFLLNRPGVTRDDSQPDATGQVSDTINPVNYSPSPGVNYVFTYSGTRERTRFGRFMSFIEPSLGVNATLMDFNDESVNLTNLLNANEEAIRNLILRGESDVQLGLGGVVTLFGNKMQVTYGANLGVDRKRGYLGFGIDFLQLLGLF